MKMFAEYVRSIIKGFNFKMNVFADEPKAEEKKEEETPEPEPEVTKEKEDKVNDIPSPTGSVNFEDLVVKARQEERNKLYPEIEKLKKKVNNASLVVGERDKTISDLTKQVETLTKSNDKLTEDVKTGKTTNKEATELGMQVTNLETQIENMKTEHELEIQSIKMESYKAQQIADAKGAIIPELVNGSTEEEIKASVEHSMKRYQEISGFKTAEALPKANPALAKTQFSASSMEDIANMSMEEYAKHRAALGVK